MSEYPKLRKILKRLGMESFDQLEAVNLLALPTFIQINHDSFCGEFSVDGCISNVSIDWHDCTVVITFNTSFSVRMKLKVCLDRVLKWNNKVKVNEH
jgi:hypothetical protein